MSPWTVFADGGYVRVCVSVRDTLLVQVLCASVQVCTCVQVCVTVYRCVQVCVSVDLYAGGCVSVSS